MDEISERSRDLQQYIDNPLVHDIPQETLAAHTQYLADSVNISLKPLFLKSITPSDIPSETAQHTMQYMQGLTPEKRVQWDNAFRRFPTALLTSFAASSPREENDRFLDNIYTLTNLGSNKELSAHLFLTAGLSFTQPVELGWLREEGLGGDPSFDKPLNNELQRERNALTTSALHFIAEELRTTTSTEDFNKFHTYSLGLLDNIQLAFNPKLENGTYQSIPADVFEQLLITSTIEGRSQVRDLVHMLLKQGKGKAASTEGEAVAFYEKFFSKIAKGEESPDTSTGDTLVEGVRAMQYLKEVGAKSVLEIGVGTGRLLKALHNPAELVPQEAGEAFKKEYDIEDFQGVKEVYGIDIMPIETLRELGLPENIPAITQNASTLTKEILQDSFGTGHVDAVLATYSVLADMNDEELVQTLANLRTITSNLYLDVPLIADVEGSFLRHMKPSSIPHVITVEFAGGAKKTFHLRTPEEWKALLEQSGWKLRIAAEDETGQSKLTTLEPNDTPQEEAFLKLVRNPKPRSTNPKKDPSWTTAMGKPRTGYMAIAA